MAFISDLLSVSIFPRPHLAFSPSSFFLRATRSLIMSSGRSTLSFVSSVLCPFPSLHTLLPLPGPNSAWVIQYSSLVSVDCITPSSDVHSPSLLSSPMSFLSGLKSSEDRHSLILLLSPVAPSNQRTPLGSKFSSLNSFSISLAFAYASLPSTCFLASLFHLCLDIRTAPPPLSALSKRHRLWSRLNAPNSMCSFILILSGLLSATLFLFSPFFSFHLLAPSVLCLGGFHSL
mmetsp:Transcript_53079/g.85904  ORF Transcript_53079/g.85904 Transcript_53079/m.85904 type:complete len:232 (-) Transcript_53079:1696-2391(-)